MRSKSRAADMQDTFAEVRPGAAAFGVCHILRVVPLQDDHRLVCTQTCGCHGSTLVACLQNLSTSAVLAAQAKVNAKLFPSGSLKVHLRVASLCGRHGCHLQCRPPCSACCCDVLLNQKSLAWAPVFGVSSQLPRQPYAAWVCLCCNVVLVLFRCVAHDVACVLASGVRLCCCCAHDCGYCLQCVDTTCYDCIHITTVKDTVPTGMVGVGVRVWVLVAQRCWYKVTGTTPCTFQQLASLFGAAHASSIMQEYAAPNSTSDYRPILSRVLTDGLFNCPTRNASRSVAHAPGSSVFAYHWRHPWSFTAQTGGAEARFCVNQVRSCVDAPLQHCTCVVSASLVRRRHERNTPPHAPCPC